MTPAVIWLILLLLWLSILTGLFIVVFQRLNELLAYRNNHEMRLRDAEAAIDKANRVARLRSAR